MASKVTFNGELLFPNDYLNAAEFKGRDVTLEISALTREMLQKKGAKDKKETVLRFHRTPKKLVCNKTNADSIAALYGSKAEKWVGKSITLYPTRCLAFGEMVDCIRVREKVTQKAQQPPADDPQEPELGGEGLPGDGEELPHGDASNADVGASSGLPDHARTDAKWIDDLILTKKPEGMAARAARDAFHAQHSPASWSAVPPATQDELYAALLDGTFGFGK